VPHITFIQWVKAVNAEKKHIGLDAMTSPDQIGLRTTWKMNLIVLLVVVVILFAIFS
jgi:hypothetical protein